MLETFAKWLNELHLLVASISSSDYFVGYGQDDLLIEKGNKRSSRHNEIRELCNKAQVRGRLIEWAKLTIGERKLIVKLLFIVGSGARLEEFNRMKDINNLHFWLSRKLGRIEALLGKELFIGSEEIFLRNIILFPILEGQAMKKNGMERVLLTETKHQNVYIPYSEPCKETIDNISSVLFGKDNIFYASPSIREKEVTNVLNEEGLDKVISTILTEIRNDFSDDIAVIAVESTKKIKFGDKIKAWAGVLGGIYSYEAKYKELGTIEKTRLPEKIYNDLSNSSIRNQKWRRKMSDIEKIPLPKAQQMRKAVFSLTQGILSNEMEIEKKFINPLFSRLVVLNLSKKLAGTQRTVQEPVVGAHLAYDKQCMAVNSSHTFIGLQSGLLLPLNYGVSEGLSDIRFMREAVREDAYFTLADIKKARAYVLWLEFVLGTYISM